MSRGQSLARLPVAMHVVLNWAQPHLLEMNRTPWWTLTCCCLRPGWLFLIELWVMSRITDPIDLMQVWETCSIPSLLSFSIDEDMYVPLFSLSLFNPNCHKSMIYSCYSKNPVLYSESGPIQCGSKYISLIYSLIHVTLFYAEYLPMTSLFVGHDSSKGRFIRLLVIDFFMFWLAFDWSSPQYPGLHLACGPINMQDAE